MKCNLSALYISERLYANEIFILNENPAANIGPIRNARNTSKYATH